MRSKSLFNIPEKAFVTIGLIFGILFLLITPPFQAADELNHYYRSFQISSGQIIAEKQQNEVGGFLPKNLVTTTQKVSAGIPFNPEAKQNPEIIFSLLNVPLESNNKVFIAFPNTAVYSPIPYLPQIIGITLGKTINLTPILIMYVGRVCNLLVWLVLGYFAIKVIPICKWTFFLLALTPMSLFQAASLSADAVTNGVSFLLIATFLQLALEPRLPDWNQKVEEINSTSQKYLDKKIFIIFLLSVLLALSKQAYFPLVGLFLLIPVEKIGNRKKYIGIFALLCLASVLAILSWSLISKGTYTTLVPNVAPSKQIQFILTHPFDLIGVILRTFFKDGVEYISQFIGKLGWMDTKLPPLFILSYLVILVFSVNTGVVQNRDVNVTHRQAKGGFWKSRRKDAQAASRRVDTKVITEDDLSVSGLTYKDILISTRQKRILLLILILNVILIATILYISWTPVAKDRVFGLQGRYFIPIAPIFFLLLYKDKFKLKIRNINMIIVLYSVLSGTLTAVVLLKRYYL